jgi:hypothetical protein
VQANESILGPIQQVAGPSAIVTSGATAPETQQQLQDQLVLADEDRQEQQQEASQQQGGDGQQSALAEGEQAQGSAKGSEKKKNKTDDDSGVDPSLGLLNTGPIQLKSDLEQPVTSGGMNTSVEDPGIRD